MSSIDLTQLTERLSGGESAICDYRVFVGDLTKQDRLAALKKATSVFRDLCRDRAGFGDHRKFLLVLSFPETLRPSSLGSEPDFVLETVESIIFYALRDFDYFPDAQEEYRRQVYVSSLGMKGVFRSWRSPEHARNNWEFSNDLYLTLDD